MGQTDNQNQLSKSDLIRIVLAAAAALCLLAAAAATWYFRGGLFGGASALRTEARQQTVFSYTPASTQYFAVSGKLLAQVTGSGFSLLSPEGKVLCSQTAVFDSPALDSCGGYAVFFDQGGQTLYFADSGGDISQYDCGGGILSLRCSESGHLALVTREAGWRGLVTVLDGNHAEVYRWYSAENYVLSARISPDGRTLAALCLNDKGSTVHFFSLTSQTQKAVFSVSDTVLMDFFWLGSDKLCALSAEGGVFFSDDGSWLAAYDFRSRYLTAYDAGDSFICLALSPYRSGTGGEIICLDAGGAELSATESDGEIISLDADGSEFLLLNTAGAFLYGANGTKHGTLSDTAGFQQAIIRNKGEALLLAAGFAEVYKF